MESYNGKEILGLILAMVIYLYMKKLGLLEQKIELQMVTGGYSDVAQ